MQAAPLICPALLLLPEQPLITRAITGCFSIQRLNSSLKSNERGGRLRASPQLRNKSTAEPGTKPTPNHWATAHLVPVLRPWPRARLGLLCGTTAVWCSQAGARSSPSWWGVSPHKDCVLRGLGPLWTALIWAPWSAWLHAVDAWSGRKIKLCPPGPDPNSWLQRLVWHSVLRHPHTSAQAPLGKEVSGSSHIAPCPLPHHNVVHLQPPSCCRGPPGQSP